MSADTFRSLRTALAVAFAASAVFQFAIQAYFAWRFAREVWGLPAELSVAVPASLDLFVVNVMVATYALRNAPLKVRAYAWMVMFVGVGAQVLAAELLAAHREWTNGARAFSVLPAVFLAFSLHFLIKVRQHTNDRPTAASRITVASAWKASRARRKASRGDTGEPRHPGQALVTMPPERPAQPPKAPPTSRPRGPRAHPNRDVAVKRVLAGERARDVANLYGVSTRAVEGWVAKARTQRDRESATVQPARTDAPVPKADEAGQDQLREIASLEDPHLAPFTVSR